MKKVTLFGGETIGSIGKKSDKPMQETTGSVGYLTKENNKPDLRSDNSLPKANDDKKFEQSRNYKLIKYGALAAISFLGIRYAHKTNAFSRLFRIARNLKPVAIVEPSYNFTSIIK